MRKSRPAISAPTATPVRRDASPAPPSADAAVAFWSRHPVAATAVLAALVLAVFWPATGNDFVYYDDNGYVIENAWVAHGLTWANVGHAFRTTEIAYWHPLTWISHLVDVELFGLRPFGHHLTSVLWHAANAGLLSLLLWRLTGALGRSWVVAALFGLHPLHVESVAWVAERKDVLSTFFSLAAIWFYAAWVRGRDEGRRGAWGWYALTLAAFALGLMSKPMVVTLPCLLLLLDYWPLRRLSLASGREAVAEFGRRLLEKVPFFVLSALASAAAVTAQASLGTLQTTERISIVLRVVNASVSYARYLGKCFWPVDLAVFYPYPREAWLEGGLLAAVLLASVTAVALWQARRRPYFLFGWLWFLGLLVPVIGIVQVGGQAMADRYSYVPLIGVFVVLVWGVAELTAAWPRRGVVLGGATAAVLAACVALTERQIALWRDTPTLFNHTLAVTERNWAAHFVLGYYYAKDPARLDDAIAHYRETVRIAPGTAEARFSLAAMLARKPGAEAEAVAEFRETLRLGPETAEARLGLGQVLLRQPGQFAAAMQELEAAQRLAPGDLKIRQTLAEALLRRADLLAERPEFAEQAIIAYREVLKLQPDWAEVHSSLGLVLAERPDGLADAIAEYEAAIRGKPAFAVGHANLANALARVPGRAADAEREYRETLRLRAGDFRDHFNYGVFLLNAGGRKAEAAAQFEAALQLQPDLAPAREILAKLRGEGSSGSQ